MAHKSELSGVEDSRFFRIDAIAETESTNADLLLAAQNGEAEGVVLVADHQRAGRGRQGRAWLDEPGASLLVSWLLRPSPEIAGLIPLATGLAAVEALIAAGLPARAFTSPTQAGPGSVGVKWPNDVLATSDRGQEHKLAGILAEATTTPDGFAVVVGMGMNLAFNGRPPVEVGDTAIDLATVCAIHSLTVPERFDLLRMVLARFEVHLRRLEKGAGPSVLDDYRARCVTLGRQIELVVPAPGGNRDGDGASATTTLAGTAVDIDPGGGLVVETTSGERRTVIAGDAHHRSH